MEISRERFQLFVRQNLAQNGVSLNSRASHRLSQTDPPDARTHQIHSYGTSVFVYSSLIIVPRPRSANPQRPTTQQVIPPPRHTHTHDYNCCKTNTLTIRRQHLAAPSLPHHLHRLPNLTPNPHKRRQRRRWRRPRPERCHPDTRSRQTPSQPHTSTARVHRPRDHPPMAGSRTTQSGKITFWSRRRAKMRKTK